MNVTAASSSSTPERIILQIGEKTYHTTRATIAESPILTNLVSIGTRNGGSGGEEEEEEEAGPGHGPYFLDADPDAFDHILRHLRTGVYPVFHDALNGHDFPRYRQLLHAARFYQLARLAAWLESESYLGAVSTRTRAGALTLHGEEQIRRMEELIREAGGTGGTAARPRGGLTATDAARARRETVRVVRVKQDGYEMAHQCPRSMWRHTGHKQDCVWDGCLSQRGALAAREVKMKVLKIEYVATVVESNEEALMAGLGGTVDGGEAADPPPYHAS